MDARFQSCDKMDRLIVFEDYLKELEQKEEETKIREKEGRKRQQRMVREEFRALLRDYSDKGLLDYTTKWQDFAQLVASDPVFGAIMKQGVRATPVPIQCHTHSAAPDCGRSIQSIHRVTLGTANSPTTLQW